MKIAVFDLEKWESEPFEKLRGDHDVDLRSESLTSDNADEFGDVEVVSPFIYSQLQRPTLERLKNLKLIATRSTGFNHIDMNYCADHDIAVANVPVYGQNTVAEHVFGLLLTISHRLDEAIDRTRKGDFSPRGLQGFDLHGKTMGVIGTGNIGMHTIRIARGFGMNVLAFDVKQDEEAARDLGFRYVAMDNLLSQSEVISLHVPLNDKTRHLLGEEEFDKMKDGAVLINTSRGDVVDIRALARALAEKKVAAAGLDVLSEEPVVREEAELLRSVYQRKHDLDTLLADHVMIRLRNVVVTPHSAFNTREAVGQILDTTVENILRFAEGSPHNVVNQEAAAR